ncbi:MAG: thioredoxin family protein [Candidatus Accumulibacter phosphatis]|uniref:Thioredoxin n=2 Tax=Candidatus Accumulibacter TaxID=327159 RepID=A0A080M648_9PROT|nr:MULTISPECIES: thioredoxin family protein [Candidatus Accumulibacter]KFB75965.1 MAG: Thioredoxin [Candidatus Accumulibacter cognatus]MBL8400646.1 thioredoxin family protein [Accumulibacter sp.]MBN8516993.1 thioredoxin family protein [Accumulibacter sp.]MBO3711566.1 thioredoxin family protein [Accumulibacter sp.]MCC2868925.1 thioredoxin family protein [Candidatus Accumulibacter phosphatis]
MNRQFAAVEPSRSQIDSLPGPALIEFGTPWCGYCLAVQPLLEAALAAYPNLPHVKIEDGPGRRLGRSFRVKLWPTLIFIEQGRELARLVRPTTVDEIVQALRRFPGQV